MDVAMQNIKVFYITQNLNKKRNGGVSRSGLDFLDLLTRHYNNVMIISNDNKKKLKRVISKSIYNNKAVTTYISVKLNQSFSIKNIAKIIFYTFKDLMKQKTVRLGDYCSINDKIIIYVNSWCNLYEKVDTQDIEYIQKVCILRGCPESFITQNDGDKDIALRNAILFLRDFDFIISVSEICRKKWLEFISSFKQTFYLPNSIDEKEVDEVENQQKYEKVFDSDYYNIVVIGSVQYRKGQDLLLDYLPLLKDYLSKIKIHVIGVVSKKYGGKEIYDKVRKSKYRDNIIFHGHKENALIYARNCNLALFTSRAEAFPRTIAEYMALGKPILTTGVSGIPEMIHHGETGLIFDYEEPNNFFENFKLLFEDENYARSLGIRARNYYFERFSKKNQVLKGMAILNEIDSVSYGK